MDDSTPAHFREVNHIASTCQKCLLLIIQATADDALAPANDAYDTSDQDSLMEGVYHTNAAGGSFTTRMLKPLLKDNSSLHSDDAALQEEQSQEQDQELRQYMNAVKIILSASGSTSLQRAQLDISSQRCSYALCPYHSNAISGGQLYFNMKGMDDQQFALLHLICLERLWNGEGFRGQLPDPSIYTEAKLEKQLGRAAAMADSTAVQRGPAIRVRRSQYLAELMVSGSNLSEHERMVLALWKYASQNHIDATIARCPLPRLRRDSAVKMDTMKQSNRMTVLEVEEKLSLLVDDCYGMDISKMMKVSV